jgi:hypothetical protein
MLIHILSKTGGSKIIHIYSGKAMMFMRMGRTKRKYESERHIDIKIN